MWGFSYSNDLTVNVGELEACSKFLQQQEQELRQLHQRLADQGDGLSQAVDNLKELLQPAHSFSISLQAPKYLQSLQDIKKQISDAQHGACIGHFADAEMHWLYVLLHDDALRDSLLQRYEAVQGPLVHLLVTKAPCDHCCHMIVAKHTELQDRFRCPVEMVIYAQSAYGSKDCTGLEQIGKGATWLTYKPLWKNV